MKKNIFIVVLILIVLGLVGYLVYDKVIDKKVSDDCENNLEAINFKEKDKEYYNQYLEAFMFCGGTFISRNTKKFTDEDISAFVTNYYIKKGDSISDDEMLNHIHVTSDEINKLVKKYFNITNYNLVNAYNVKVKKASDGYDFEWDSIGCGYLRYDDPTITYNGNNVTVKYKLYDTMTEKYTGEYETFYLKYNKGDYNIVKIEHK